MNRLNDEILKKLNSIDEKIREGIDEFLTLQQAAEYLGFKPSYMYKLTHRRLLPFYKPTKKKLFFKKSDLDNWISTNKKISTSEIKEISDSYLGKKISERIRYRDKSSKKLDAE